MLIKAIKSNIASSKSRLKDFYIIQAHKNLLAGVKRSRDDMLMQKDEIMAGFTDKLAGLFEFMNKPEPVLELDTDDDQLISNNNEDSENDINDDSENDMNDDSGNDNQGNRGGRGRGGGNQDGGHPSGNRGRGGRRGGGRGGRGGQGSGQNLQNKRKRTK